jgi:hypothetical protein
MTELVDKLARLYVNKVVRLYGISISIVSDWDLSLHPGCGQVSNML